MKWLPSPTVRAYYLHCMLWSRTGRITLATLLLLSGMSRNALCGAVGLTCDQVIQKALERASSIRHEPNSDYTYTKVNVTEELDGKGKVKQRKKRVFQVSFRGGTTSVKLIQVDGHSPAGADLKNQAETQSGMRQLFGKPNSGEDNRESILTLEVVARFDFVLVGQACLNGRPAYQIHFAPKTTEPPVRHMIDRLLDRISGTLWIDSEEFEVARADLELGSEVDFLGGVLGSLRKVVYSMTRIRVADGLWLHSVSCGDFEGRKLLDSMRIKTKSESTNFRFLAANQ